MATTRITVLVVAALVFVTTAHLGRGEPSGGAWAIGALRAITSAQAAYMSANGGYAPSLTALATACPQASHGFVSPDLADDPTIRMGYEIRVQTEDGARPGPADCNGVATSRGYYATSTPVPGTPNAGRAFATDRSGVIWYDTSGIPPGLPFKQTGTIKRLQ
jgi:hypothetical protein